MVAFPPPARMSVFVVAAFSALSVVKWRTVKKLGLFADQNELASAMISSVIPRMVGSIRHETATIYGPPSGGTRIRPGGGLR